MTKTITVFYRPGGGTHGLFQLATEKQIEESLGVQSGELSDVNVSCSIGSNHGCLTKIKAPRTDGAFLFSSSDLIDPMIDVAVKMCGHTTTYGHYKGLSFDDVRRCMGRLVGKKAASSRYDSGIYKQSLNETIGDLKLTDLGGNHIVPTHLVDEERNACFSKLDPQIFDADGLASMKNLGGGVTVTDAIMASTPAPLTFPSYEIEGIGKFIDYAHAFNIAETMRDIFRMADMKAKSLKAFNGAVDLPNFRLVVIGTGYNSQNKFDIEKMDTAGTLLNMSDLIKHPVLANLQGSLQSLMADFNDRLDIHMWDVDVARYSVPNTIKNSDDGFSGNREHLEWKVDIATQEAKLHHDARMRVADQIMEDKIKSVDPLQGRFACVANSPSKPTVVPEKPSMLSRLSPFSWGRQAQTPKPQGSTLQI